MRNSKKIITVILTCALVMQTELCNADVFPLYPSNSCTIQETEETKASVLLDANIVKATELLKELFDYNYNRELDHIKDKIAEKGYDYELTMQSVMEQGNPFEGVDVVKTIAALCTILESSDIALSEIPLIRTYYQEYSVQEYIPEKIKKYQDIGNGYYKEDGYQYIKEPQEIDLYVRDGDYYKKSGNRFVNLKMKDSLCAEVTMVISEGADLFESMGNTSKYLETYNKRLYYILNLSRMDTTNLYQNIFVQDMYSSIELLSLEEQQALTAAIENAHGNRKKLLTTASLLVERIPYEWGGKAKAPGYDNSWWTYDTVSKKQNGLDCSGYVQWCFMTAGYKETIYQGLLSTGSILKNTEIIEKEELEAGDLGLLHHGESGINHVGIYLGNDYWIHCSSGRNTVTVSKCNFKVFRRVNGIETELIRPYMVTLPEQRISYTNEDVILLAKLICNEARGEGLNTWIAVGEVVVNRIKSNLFPDTMKEVIYQENKEGVKQFSNNERIETMVPTEEILRAARGVLEGTMQIFGDEDVLFFRNPGDMTNNEDWGPFPFALRIGPVCFYRKMNN